MARMTHPTIPGSDVEVPDISLLHHRASGWLVIGEDVEGPIEALPEEPASEADAASETKAPKRRPSGSAKEN